MNNSRKIHALAVRMDGIESNLIAIYWEMGDVYQTGTAEGTEWKTLRECETVTGVSKSRLSRADKVRSAFATAAAAQAAYMAADGATITEFVGGLAGKKSGGGKDVTYSKAEIAAAKRLVKSADFKALPERVQKSFIKAMGF